MNTSTETCPSLEDLAAFLDGRLFGDERAQVIVHLADCSRCYEIFAEAARFQISEEGEDKKEDDPRGTIRAFVKPTAAATPAKVVVPLRRQRVLRWISSIAAVLAAVALAVPLYQQYYTTPELSSKELINPRLVQDSFWPVFRGGPAATSLMMTPHEVLLGAQLVDLRLGLLRKDDKLTDDALASINGHIDALGSQADAQEKFYEDARVRPSKRPLAQDFLRQAEQMEASFRSTSTSYLDFGKWLEAGRLSSLAQSPDFFQVSRNLRFPKAFLHQEREVLEPEVARPLGDILEALDTSGPSSLPYKDLQENFRNILKYYQIKSEESLSPVP